jgi:hypothetical protein
MTKALILQQAGDPAAADLMTGFGQFLRWHTADGDASSETIQSYYGNMAQFVGAACLEGL